jgi:hypothetical protein
LDLETNEGKPGMRIEFPDSFKTSKFEDEKALLLSENQTLSYRTGHYCTNTTTTVETTELEIYLKFEWEN